MLPANVLTVSYCPETTFLESMNSKLNFLTLCVDEKFSLGVLGDLSPIVAVIHCTYMLLVNNEASAGGMG